MEKFIKERIETLDEKYCNLFTIYKGLKKDIRQLIIDSSQLEPRVKQLLADVEDYKQTFDLQHKRYIEANLYWQKATGRLHTWNDLGELLKFLMDRIVELETPKIISGEPFRVEKVDSKQSV
jgi:hypothetical protein